MDNKYDVSLMSRNTGYCWYVHCVGVPVGGYRHVLFFISINMAILTTGVVVVTVSSRQSGIFRVAICGK